MGTVLWSQEILSKLSRTTGIRETDFKPGAAPTGNPLAKDAPVGYASRSK